MGIILESFVRIEDEGSEDTTHVVDCTKLPTVVAVCDTRHTCISYISPHNHDKKLSRPATISTLDRSRTRVAEWSFTTLDKSYNSTDQATVARGNALPPS